MPATILSNSPDKCGELPLPPDAKFIVFGFALAMATSSFTDFAGTDGCTTRMFGCETTSETGAKSFTVSNGNLLIRLGFTVWVVVTISRV